MKLPLLLVFASCIFTINSYGQRTANVGLSGGVVNYTGDLGNEKYFPFSSASPGVAITLRNFINNPKKSHNLYPAIDAQVRLSWHRLQYDETTPIGVKKGIQLRNYLRGIGFRNDQFGSEIDFTYNVSNKFARAFYERHGVTDIEKAFELQWDPGKSRVMVTKYCVRYELGKCARYQRKTMGEKLVEPLTLKHGEVEYKLKFNCKPCEMEIWEKDAELVHEDED